MFNPIDSTLRDGYLVTFHLSSGHLQQVSDRAKLAGVSPSEWVNQAVSYCLSKQPSQPSSRQAETVETPAPPPVDTDDDEDNPF